MVGLIIAFFLLTDLRLFVAALFVRNRPHGFNTFQRSIQPLAAIPSVPGLQGKIRGSWNRSNCYYNFKGADGHGRLFLHTVNCGLVGEILDISQFPNLNEDSLRIIE